MKGNPPRKSDHSYGDAIIWETLLKEGKNDNLVLITKDGDFAEIHKGKPAISQFLFVEWRIKTKKKKRVVLYKSLAEFVNSFNKKETIKKEIVQKENDSSVPIITKRLSYEIQGSTGPTGPFEIHTASGYPSSILTGININNSPTLSNPKYDSATMNPSILGVSGYGSSIYTSKHLCTMCQNPLPEQVLVGPIFCPVCGTFNY